MSESTAPGGSLPRLVRRDTVVRNGSAMILLVPSGRGLWDKYVWREYWMWDDELSDRSARQWLSGEHYIAPNNKLSHAAEPETHHD